MTDANAWHSDVVAIESQTIKSHRIGSRHQR